MIIRVKMSGGLGNQMFCYAFYLRMKNQYPLDKIVIDYNSYKFCMFHNGLRLAQVFKLNYPFNLKTKYNIIESLWYKLCTFIRKCYYDARRTPIVHENIDEFQSFENGPHNNTTVLFDGTWGSDFYFQPIEDIIKRTFRHPSKEISDNVTSLAKEMQLNESVFIHVRRGDYLKTNFVDLSNTTYYKNSIQYIKDNVGDKDLHLYIISDDPEYCKSQFDYLINYTVTYISGNKDYEDLYLMSQCKYAIIANSTFSWWGAYVSDAKIVCAPFYRLKNKQDRPYSPYPSKWKIIK